MPNDKYMMAKCKKGTSMNMIILTAHEMTFSHNWRMKNMKMIISHDRRMI